MRDFTDMEMVAPNVLMLMIDYFTHLNSANRIKVLLTMLNLIEEQKEDHELVRHLEHLL